MGVGARDAYASKNDHFWLVGCWPKIKKIISGFSLFDLLFTHYGIGGGEVWQKLYINSICLHLSPKIKSFFFLIWNQIFAVWGDGEGQDGESVQQPWHGWSAYSGEKPPAVDNQAITITITITMVFTRTVDAIFWKQKVSAFLAQKSVGRMQKFCWQNLQQNGRNGDTHSAECRSAFSVNFLVQMQNNWQWQQNPRHALSECMTSPDFYLLRRTQGQGNL